MWSVIAHGGAGVIDDARETAHVRGVSRACDLASSILRAGGAAMDAVCSAVRFLEDDPTFNAGIGGALDERGVVAMDAALMRGSDCAYGAVGAIVGVRHPIDLARAVLEDGRHCLLVGLGAIDFAREKGIELEDPHRFAPENPEAGTDLPCDTVGVVALDEAGVIVVGTSTGGTRARRKGRIGDSPIAGAGTYAENVLGGLSATGHGETMLRTVFAFRALVAMRAADAGARADAVLRDELEHARALTEGRGGAIAILPSGRPVWARNTAHMGVAYATSDGVAGVDF